MKKNNILSKTLIDFYFLWHGKLGFKGAGRLLNILARNFSSLQNYVLRLPEGQAVHLDLRDVSAFHWLNHTLGERFEEEALVSAIAEKTCENTVIWDIGANCGLLSYRLAKEANARQIYFFEPNPSVFRLAQEATSTFESVHGFELALSNISGDACMIIPQGGSTSGSLSSSRTDQAGSRHLIKCRTGDELVEEQLVDPPQIIKIDTEGHELDVIQGLRNTIRKHRPTVFFEHISLSDREILQIVPDQYELYSICNSTGSIKKCFDRSRGHNFVLIPCPRQPPQH